MVLYHVISVYHLLNAMVHSCITKEKSKLITSQWIPEKLGELDGLQDFFDEIVVHDANYLFMHSVEESSTYFNQLLGPLSQFSTIYAWGGHFSLPYTLAYNDIPFIFCEDGAGVLSQFEILHNFDLNSRIKNPYVEKMKILGLYNGSSKSIISILCNVSAQNKKINTYKNIINFNISNELLNLEKKDRDRIINFFVPNQKKINIINDCTIVLTQHFTNLGVLTFNNQALIYQIFIDYFIRESSFAIKLHPSDLMHYRQLFPGAQVIREKFPSEFIPFLFEPKPARVATISSTAIYNLRESFDEILELDTRYEKDFPYTHRYYAAVKIAQALGKDIVCYSANEVLADRLCSTLGEGCPTVLTSMPQQYSNSMILVDDVTEQGEEGRENVRLLLQGLPADSCVLFINSKADYCWYDYDYKPLWNHILPVVLHKRAIEPKSEDFYASLDDETIYLYSTDKETLTMVKNMEMEKELPHTGITVTKQQFTPDQERIKVLEGILAATERRLLYYIEKERKEK